MEGASIDLLHIKNANRGDVFQRETYNCREEENDLELELSLGLSTNGRFGVDPASKKLRRSASSISNLDGTSVDNRGSSSHRAIAVEIDTDAPLVRTFSLPAHHGFIKSLHTMSSVESRKKRMEKLKNVRVVKDHKDCLDGGNNGTTGLQEGVNGNFTANRNLNLFENVKLLIPSSSIGSNRSGSYGISDVHYQQIEGAKQIAKSKSTSSIQSFQKPIEQLEGTNKNASGPIASLKNAISDMPYVSTKGDGLNLNGINGLLYRYKKADEIRIVCVCHGFFLSAAEFMKHGGGGDVENPLKHIVIM